MSFSYSGDPSASALDTVRFLLGDTDASDPLLSNEEVTWVNSKVANNYLAAALCADIIAAKFTRETSYQADGVGISGDELQQKFITLASELRATALRFSGSAPYVGGISKADVTGNLSDTDWEKPPFGEGMHDSIFAGNQDIPGEPQTDLPDYPFPGW